MKHSLAPRRAFTLIEILVVLAIIGILSALLFPVFSRARENGRKTVCLSNMKQLGLAFAQYAQDSRGKYPLGANYQAWDPGFAHWVAGSKQASMVSIVFPPTATTPPSEVANPKHSASDSVAQPDKGALFPYVKSTKVYFCPSAEFGSEMGLSYSMNCAVSGLGLSRITSPGDIVLLVDERYPTDGWFYARNICDVSKNACSTDALQDRHNGGGNLLFADGHAKFFTNEQFTLDYTPDGLANKSKLTGSPRFHDRAFGSVGGSSLVPFQNDGPGKPKAGVDSCLVSTATVPVPGP